MTWRRNRTLARRPRGRRASGL